MLMHRVLLRCFLQPVRASARKLCLNRPCRDLMEFFDDQNWGESTVTAGRPWREDELRLKSNLDLHKLWYVLLKERNMLMTMEEEHNRCLERMPNMERFEKVEESMENIMCVVEERNRAEAELELGEWVGPAVVYDVDPLGRLCKRLTSEHSEPKVADKRATIEEQMWGDKTVELLRLEREQENNRVRNSEREKRLDARLARWKRLDYIDQNSV